MKSIRLAFAGASGTGKSTLATYAADLLGLPLNPVGSRSVAAAMGFANPYDVDRVGLRAAFQWRLLTEKISWERDHESFVSDRTVLDNLAYQVLHSVHSVTSFTLDLVTAGAQRYTHVVYCQGVFSEASTDPARAAEPAYHAIYDTFLDGLVARYTSPVTQRILKISARDPDERKRYLKIFLGLVDS